MDAQQPAPEGAAANDDAEALLTKWTELAASLIADLKRASEEAREQQARLVENETNVAALLGTVMELSAAARSMHEQLSQITQSGQQKISELEAHAESGRTTIDQKLAEATSTISGKLAELDANLMQARELLNTKAADLEQIAGDKIASLQSSAGEATAKLSTATAASTDAESHASRAKEILSQIEVLRQEVLSHHSVTSEALASKEKFEKDSAAKLLAFDALVDEIGLERRAHSEFATNSKEEIDRLVKEADAMLFGATNAGLATAFKNEVRALDRQLVWASGTFIVGIVGLFGALYWLFQFVSQISEQHQLTAIDLAAGMLIRTAIVVPAVWFSYFFSRRAYAIFELRQHYVHKASLAASVEPFRRQAGEHASAAVAGVLREILHNPASILRRHKKMADGPDEGTAEIANVIRNLASQAQRPTG